MATTDTDTRSPLDLAVELTPCIRSYADEIEAERELPRPLFEILADAGLFRMLIPGSLGGRELDLPTYIRVIEALGRADASTGWVINQGGVWATYWPGCRTISRDRSGSRRRARSSRTRRRLWLPPPSWREATE